MPQTIPRPRTTAGAGRTGGDGSDTGLVMQLHEFYSSLAIRNDNKIVVLVVDGLGGMSHKEYGYKTELEYASHPNLDRLASRGATGMLTPVLPGVTPGSGPAHIGLFGLDPILFHIGRGVLEALGIGLIPEPTDVFARGNFCTVDDEGTIVDRRAGRIPTETCEQRLDLLRDIRVPRSNIELYAVQDHRFVLRVKGADLDGSIANTDPGSVGAKPKPAKALTPQAEATANIVNAFVDQALDRLRGQSDANALVLRGFSMLPKIPSFYELYDLRSAALAIYPMYKGLARTVGMEILDCGNTFPDQLRTLETHWNEYDYFFIHYKYTDSCGEDGNFLSKVNHIETLDRCIDSLTRLDPAVLAVTGDHSTPAALKSHSWHPVPLLLVSSTCRRDGSMAFTESACAKGALGNMESKYLMGLLLAHALRLEKFGA
ncbi:MAG TPA: 2,3-bisphosphoglycerate-independent phosphoglycerate mutase [Bryobacteraceae bacterium]|nr:2,3-bisphosphoglycerate-independent phosphoglycerate mutase [Bryobacteraceae bacterium]